MARVWPLETDDLQSISWLSHRWGKVAALCASVSSFVPNNSIYFLGTEVTAQVRGPVFGSGHARGKGLRNARAQLLPGSAARPLPGPPATPLLVGHVPITRPPEVGDTHTTIPHSRL